MKLSKFKFDLPQEQIALHPTENRDESRMMVVHRDTGEIEHRVFKEMIDYFEKGDTFVFNDTKVFPARLFGYKEKTGARIEVFLLRELNPDLRRGYRQHDFARPHTAFSLRRKPRRLQEIAFCTRRDPSAEIYQPPRGA